MIVKNSICLIVVFILISILIGYFFGYAVPFSIQKTLATSLGGVSSILFGVLGIWIGILAPDNLKCIYSTSETCIKKEKWKELENLYRPVFISLLIFVISTSFIFFGELLKIIPLFILYHKIFRTIGLSVLILLLFSTFYLVIISIRPGIEMLAYSINFINVSENMDIRYPDKSQRNIKK